MMHQQNGDAVLVRQRFQNADVPVVTGIRIRVIARSADALERVDDDLLIVYSLLFTVYSYDRFS